jgi:hypothetical protein
MLRRSKNSATDIQSVELLKAAVLYLKVDRSTKVS